MRFRHINDVKKVRTERKACADPLHSAFSAFVDRTDVTITVTAPFASSVVSHFIKLDEGALRQGRAVLASDACASVP